MLIGSDEDLVDELIGFTQGNYPCPFLQGAFYLTQLEKDDLNLRLNCRNADNVCNRVTLKSCWRF